MVTGAIKNKVDKIWIDIAAGGITNPLTVIEQLTYLMFIRSLDEKETESDGLANMGIPVEHIFPQSEMGQSMRWSHFINKDAREMFQIIGQRVFPAIKTMKNGVLPDISPQGDVIEAAGDAVSSHEETAFARYMGDAMFLIPTPQLLQKVVTGIEDLFQHDL